MIDGIQNFYRNYRKENKNKRIVNFNTRVDGVNENKIFL